MTRQQVYNFSAGPSVLPESALTRARDELLNYNGTGMSVMEMSHRSSVYIEIFDSVKQKLKDMLGVPNSHDILFLQGGATMQFSMAAMNLMGVSGSADYAVTGNFSASAAKEAAKYGTVNIACDTSECGHTRIPGQDELKLTAGASYFYYCSNNTIYGTEWAYVPETSATIVCDMSSNILSKPVDVSKYGLIFAGAQKNMAPAGLTVAIIDRALLGKELPFTPTMMGYKLMAEKDSMYNTPPCYNIYMLGLTLDWVTEKGGLEAMRELAAERAAMLYDFLDNSRLFRACARKGSRSNMNVTFRAGDEALDAAFVKEASMRGMLNLKGHRVAGGMRASIYNAMPIEGARALVEFMKEFELQNI